MAGDVVASIEDGLLVLLGIEQGDAIEQAEWLATKTVNLRIFASESKAMDRSVIDVEGAILVVSQFTLIADTRKGNRPSFSKAADPSIAEPLVDHFVTVLRRHVKQVQTGRFGENMQVSLVNDGPVTLLLHRA